MKKTSIFLLLFFLVSLSVYSQEVTIKDDHLAPLSGATLILLPDSTVFVTDAAGKIALSLSSEQRATISFVGFEERVISLSPESSLTVVLTRSNRNLNDQIVEGFGEDKPLTQQAGSIAKISPGALKRFDESSLVNAVNTIPGVRFEQRAGASYRVSIRGSSIRSPFGVRNVKVYWNGIPFTEPGGNTFLNLLDISSASNLEIIKGPAASLYGAGNGGVIKIESTDISQLANRTALSTTVGSFGNLQLRGQFNNVTDRSSLTVKWSDQRSDGYREHNAMDRETLEFDALFFPSDRRTISTSFLYSDLFYEIPGGLNPDQRDENPRQSRPGSIERNASVANEFYLLTVGQEYDLSENWSNKTNLGLSFSDFTNPFILDYKSDNQQVFSLRSVFDHDLKLGGRPLRVDYGLELQKSFFDGKNFGNVGGQADTIRFADEIVTDQKLLFTNVDYQVNDRLNLTFGVSRNELTYDIDRTIDKINNAPQNFRKVFDKVWSPRLAISQQLGNDYSLHLSVMGGFSPPTTTEVRTNEGSINLGLQAERGTNYELNFRGSTFSQKLSFDVALFYFQLTDAITTFTDGQGVVLFRNAGGTDQKGLELSTKMDWIRSGRSGIKNLSTTVAYTYHDFQFENYIDDGDDFSGNALPGTAPHVFNLQTDLILRGGTYLNLTYHYADPIPLNDSNTFFSSAYNLVNLRAGHSLRFSDVDVEVFGGIDNLLDVSYSLGNDLNAFGRRYYQPAATINYYVGFKLILNN